MNALREFSNEPERFSRNWWSAVGRQLLWVSLITVLIWLFADMQFVDVRDVRVNVVFTTGDNPNLVIRGQNEAEIRYELQGNRTALESLIRELNTRGLEIRYDVSGRGTGEKSITSREIIRAALDTRMKGITVQSASPEWVPLELGKPIEKYHVWLRLVAGNDRVLLDEARHEINVELEGNRESLERLGAELATRSGELVYELPANLPLGEQTLSVEEILSNMPLLSQLRLNAIKSSPQQLRVNIDQQVTVPDVPVELEHTGATLARPATITPATVSVRLARSVWEKLKDSKPTIKTRVLDLSKESSEKPISRMQELVPSIASNAVVAEPSAVSVTVEVSQRDATRELMVPVRVLSPVSWAEDGTWQNYQLVLKDPAERRKTIRVQGAKSDVDRLDPQTVQAYIVLREEDKNGSWWTGNVQVDLPPELQLRVVSEQLTIQYKLQRIDAPLP